ncbi:involucrin-like [Siniperca chuatsi]|uniref:involucrin-like n=1 Tax=Siniperca chuatsi TaxID=119488 RepID=UPI001CE1073F|nr:involucrin-like [Siniperca chuatsi]
MDRAEGEKSVTDEKVSLITAEGETHLKQDMIGRQVQNDGDKGEGEQTMKPVKGDSGLPMVLVGEGQKEQLHNLHTDQEVQKEEETQKQGQLQAVQQPNRRPQTQTNVKRGEKGQLQEKELHVDQQQAVRKRRRQEEGKEETQKTKKPKEQNKGETNIEQDVKMEVEGEANTEQEKKMDVEGEANREQEEKMEVEANREQEVKDEPQKCDMNSQLGQAHVCQENQQVEPMDS